MIGRIRPRPGWPARQDGRYQTPTSWTCCGRTTGRTCAKSSPTLCWPSLLRKLAWAECVGRARHRRDGCGDVSLLPTSRLDRLVDPPPGDTFVAASFAIIQEDEAGKVKLRRGCAGPITTPQYRPPTSPLTTWWATMWICQTVRLWGYDLLNAYHQWPVKVPSHSGTILRTVSGPTLSFHHAMCFGAAASVWNFNGAGDALQFLTPTLLFLVGGHYVDDFNGVDATDLADSAFHGFADFFLLMGLNTKASKSPGEGSSSAWDATAPPWRRPKNASASLRRPFRRTASPRRRPTAWRASSILSTRQCLVRWGASVAPIYASNKSELTPGLQAALLAIAALLQQVPPRLVPFTAPRAVNCVV